jgi:hypothetical protein
LGEILKNKKKYKSCKKKDHLELSKELYVSNGNNIEKNVINLLKNNDSSRK